MRKFRIRAVQSHRRVGILGSNLRAVLGKHDGQRTPLEADSGRVLHKSAQGSGIKTMILIFGTKLRDTFDLYWSEISDQY